MSVGLLLTGCSGEDAPEAAPDRPDGVILIPGYGGGSQQLLTLRDELTADGDLVEVLDIDDGLGDINDYADRALTARERLIDSGAGDVSVIGYSEGGLTARAAATKDADAFDRVITLAAPHQGTLWAGLGVGFESLCPQACQQMAPDSDFLAGLPGGPGDGTWLSLWSTSDEVIRPPDSSEVSGAQNVSIQSVCPNRLVMHGEVPLDPFVLEAVPAFLADGVVPSTCPAPAAAESSP